MSVLNSSVVNVAGFSGLFSDAYHNDGLFTADISERIAGWTGNIVDACVAIAGRSCLSEPHVRWLDSATVELVPSDFQFTFLECHELDLVYIEDDELLFRSYCENAIAELEQYRSYEFGWDGEEMPAPNQHSIDDAYTFLRLLSSSCEECVEAIPMLDHEGISSIAFENESDYMSVAFYGGNRVVTYRWCNLTEQSSVSKDSLDRAEFLNSLMQDIAKL